MGMVQSPKKLFFIGLLVIAGLLFAHTSGATAQSQPQDITTMQPRVLNHTGIYKVRQLDPNLTGKGVKIAAICRSFTYTDDEPENDYRPNIKHKCFSGKDFRFYDDGTRKPGISPHSTAICSILFGEDPSAFDGQLGQFSYEGVIPDAEANIYEFWYFLINNVFPTIPPEADIVTASFGSQFEDWWTRGIESLVEQYGLVVVAGIGNGQNAHDPLLYPGAGSNVIGVGVVDTVTTTDMATSLSQLALAYPEYSSFGPSIDGRCKPDIVAPGNCLASDANDPNAYEPTGSWSSFATPIVAGTIGLLVQKAKQEPNLGLVLSPNAGNCVIKAIIMNSATKLPYWHKGLLGSEDNHSAPLDYIQGAGMLNAEGAYKQFTAGMQPSGKVANIGWDLAAVDKSNNVENVYEITIDKPVGKLVTATLVWNNHYKNTYPFDPLPEKNANLRLELWAVDANNPDNDYLLDYCDSLADNVEHIYHPTDANFTNYELVISYSDVNDTNQANAAEPYGLAWNVSSNTNSDNILLYDLNCDGIVDDTDVNIFIENWLSSITAPKTYSFGDIDDDGKIDTKDLDIFLKNIGRKADWYNK